TFNFSILSYKCSLMLLICYFFFNDTTTTEIYTLSLHDALPIFLQPGVRCQADRLHPVDAGRAGLFAHQPRGVQVPLRVVGLLRRDRKSTRLNSSHVAISYAVFCLKKKKTVSIGILQLTYSGTGT